MSGTTAAEADFAVRAMGGVGSRRVAVIDDHTSYSATLAESTAAARTSKVFRHIIRVKICV